jgi:hypothetical protein
MYIDVCRVFFKKFNDLSSHVVFHFVLALFCFCFVFALFFICFCSGFFPAFLLLCFRTLIEFVENHSFEYFIACTALQNQNA